MGLDFAWQAWHYVGMDVHFAWQVGHFVTWASTVPGRRGLRGASGTRLTVVALSHTQLCRTDTTLSNTSLTHARTLFLSGAHRHYHTHMQSSTNLSHIQLCLPQLRHTPYFTYSYISHTQLWLTHNFVTRSLSHRALLHISLSHRIVPRADLCHMQLNHR